MENPATLLTAIMFVTILGMAIGNLLMTCADIAGGLRKPRPDKVHLSWMVLLLLAMLNLFWQTILILDVPDWVFLDFLYVISGPMILLFATGIIIAPASEESDTPLAHYFAIAPRFFFMMALHEAWLIGMDISFDALSGFSLISGVLLLLFLALARTRNRQVHVAANVLAWIGFSIEIPIQAFAG